MLFSQRITLLLYSLLASFLFTHSFTIITPSSSRKFTSIRSTSNEEATTTTTTTTKKEPPRPSAGLTPDHIEPEDAIIHIAPKAMKRLRELKTQQKDNNNEIILRMGVRNGGCSGLSYVMDFSTRDAIEDDDAVDVYEEEGIVCVVDSKSMLYLYGLELDYSDELIGGGFKFFNPNAEESCGCGSSFGV